MRIVIEQNPSHIAFYTEAHTNMILSKEYNKIVMHTCMCSECLPKITNSHYA